MGLDRCAAGYDHAEPDHPSHGFVLGLLRPDATTTAPWSNVYGVARTLLASATALTLMTNGPSVLFHPAVGVPSGPACNSVGRISLFCVFGADGLASAEWLAIAVLLVVASGWRPRFTALPHWWISFSLFASATLSDGGDQVTNVLSLLIIPIALTDPRPWHWGPPPAGPPWDGSARQRVALFALAGIRLQVCGIYLHSSLAKLAVAEWVDGTAMSYWLTDSTFGTPGWLRAVTLPLIAWGPTVLLATWGTIALEFALAVTLVLPRPSWRYLLVAGLALHVGIAIFMGLVSFSLAMTAALILYLRPSSSPFRFPAFALRPRARVNPPAQHAAT